MKCRWAIAYLGLSVCLAMSTYAQPSSTTNQVHQQTIRSVLSPKQVKDFQKSIKKTPWPNSTHWSIHFVNDALLFIWPNVEKLTSTWPIYILEKSHNTWQAKTLHTIPLNAKCTQYVCTAWKLNTHQLALCNHELISLQYTVSDAKVSKHRYLHLLTWDQNQWYSVFHHPVYEHYFAHAHREASTTRTILSANLVWNSKHPMSSSRILTCNQLQTSSIQKARSFNLVDAPEREFAHAEEEEVTWIYQSLQKKFIEEEDEDLSEIKIRDR